MFRWLKKDRRTAAAAAAAGAGADGEKRATQPPPGNVSSSDGSDDIRRRKSAFSYDGNLSEFDSDDMESSTAALATDEELSGVVIGGSRGRASTRTRGDDLDMEGLTLITVDDGKGGLKHVKVAKPPEGQEDSVVVTPVDENGGVGGKAGKASGGGGGSRSGSGSGSGSALTKKPSLGDMLRKEFKGRSLFQLEGEKLRKRIVSKKGVVHIGINHMAQKEKRRFITDFFNTMLDMKWRYVFLIFFLSFFLSWLAFAGVWYVIVFAHGDLDEGHLPEQQAASGWSPCVYNIHNFASCFLFSVETQHTIGYGGRQTTEQCPEAILVMSFQSVIGVIIQACMVGTIFAKLTRPKKRAQTLLFSKNAVVCQRDGYLCLCFRVGNMRHSQLVETHVRAILVSKKVTEEGEVIPFYQTELQIGTDMEGSEDTLFFIWPATIMHRIDEASPFYNMSARDFLKKRYEIIVVLEGIVEPTGMSIQARSSFLPNEILWGYRFANLLSFKRKDNEYQVDYGCFNKVDKVETPTCSAKAIAEYKARVAVAASEPSKLFRRSTIEGSRPSASEPRRHPSLASSSDLDTPRKSLLSNHVDRRYCVDQEIRSAGNVATAVVGDGNPAFAAKFSAGAVSVVEPTTPIVML